MAAAASPLAPAKPTPAPLPARIDRLKALMAKHDCDAIISFKPENSFYLTGFNPIIYSQPVIAIITPDHEPIMLVHALRDEHSRGSSWLSDIRLFGYWSSKVTLGANWLDALATVFGDLGCSAKRIGIEENFVSIDRMKQLRQALPGAQFTDAGRIIERCRLIKDSDEIGNARIAAKLSDIGMDAAYEALRAGRNEREICVSAMHAMNQHWSANYPEVEVCDFGSLEGGVQNNLSFWALSGERTFYNCDNPSQRTPKRGDAVTLLSWTIANGIHAENERTVAVGSLPSAYRKAMDDILEIRSEVDLLIKPGVPFRDIYNASKSRLESRGYGAYLPGRIGHSIGLGAHEQFSIDAKSDEVLEPNMLITFEPHIQIYGEVQTQISDTILITAQGREYLTLSHAGYLEV
ncbi:Xaa-Pro peptidase family protein [Bosea sp. (in: a-proteobacteria)]|uniref:M24 family metallopeptidase n=1 Tax=Bosea sp. (in: a-proteobacteria) TaxID=1871050 RepID=UPI002DDD313E|nr:Xaa-Pro peptidase family protein [Bosea sp. (in: a-proteobacteria)]HEV2512598.1 Xaa-Pro peptidase family protein [Bosea sp. (in: a-proteobacteria)]